MTKEELELNARERKDVGKNLEALRKQGLIPAIVYGEGQNNVPIQVDYQEFRKVFEQAGESTILKLKIQMSNAKEEIKNVLIHDVAKDPVSDKFIHIDFYQVRMDKAITAEVPLVFEGESAAVKELEGTLIKTITEVEVESLPADLPHEIRIDISVLKTFDDHIKAKDLKLPDGVKLVDIEPEEVIASVAPPRTEQELAELEEKVEEAPTEVGVPTEVGKEAKEEVKEAEEGEAEKPEEKSEESNEDK